MLIVTIQSVSGQQSRVKASQEDWEAMRDAYSRAMLNETPLGVVRGGENSVIAWRFVVGLFAEIDTGLPGFMGSNAPRNLKPEP